MAKPTKNERRPDVPNKDHVARYCSPKLVKRDPETRSVIGVFPEAFELKVNEEYLSTRWIEFFREEENSGQFKMALEAFRKTFQGVKPNGAFAKLHVGSILEAGKKQKCDIRVQDRSSLSNLGYAGIFGMPSQNSDALLLQLLATECCIETCQINDIDNDF